MLVGKSVSKVLIARISLPDLKRQSGVQLHIIGLNFFLTFLTISCSQQHGVNLEWGVIGLITCEVAFGLMHWIDKLYGGTGIH